MRVVVTGATGNVGTALLDVLSADPVVTEIRGLARRKPSRSWPKTSFSSVDVVSDELAPHLRGADAVVHLAWVFQPTHRPLETWRNNVGGSSRLLRAAGEHQIPILVCASSVGAYSPAHGRQVDETWPTESLPTAGYGREKAYVERMLDAFEARHPETRVVRLRTAFIFQRSSGSQQRRLFAGPLAPTPLLRRGRIPVVPHPAGLRFQALHALDAAAAYHLALTTTSRGAFNIAAEPVIDGTVLAGILGGRPVPLPPRLVRAALGLGWRTHLVPADPALFDLAMGLPEMHTTRARAELGWKPSSSATEALSDAITGMAQGDGDLTGPLAPDTLAGRARELFRGIGERP